MALIRGASFAVDNNGKLIADTNKNIEKVSHMTTEFEEKLNEKLFKKDNVYYGQNGQGKPLNPVIGDVYWDSTNATDGYAYQYDGANWKRKDDSIKSLFGAQIYGLGVHGAEIVGGTFKSENWNELGTRPAFSVDTNGEIYGANFTKDLVTKVASGHNGRTYVGYVDENAGFNINNGIMTMQAKATNHLGHDNIPYENYYAETFVEPDYIKLRGLVNKPGDIYDDGNTDPIKRTDIRSGEIVLGDGWATDIAHRTIVDNNHIQANTAYFGNIPTSRGENGLYASNITANQADINGVFIGKSNIGQTSLGTTSGSDLYIHDPYDRTVNIHAGDIISHGKLLKNSALSLKKDIKEYNNKKALSQILATDIYSWRYKDQTNTQKANIGPIIDDINDVKHKKYSISNDLTENADGGVTFNESNAISLLIASVQELTSRVSEQNMEIELLKRKIVNLEKSTK